MSYQQAACEPIERGRILGGVTALSDAVRRTLGPKSRRVRIGRNSSVPFECGDGATIAREFELEDPFENLGVHALRQAAERTGRAVGDGTTTTTLLAHAIFSESLRNVLVGVNAGQLACGLERGLAAASRSLAEQSQPVQRQQEKVQLATAAARGEAQVGKLVAEALERVGDSGPIRVEESDDLRPTLEVVNGLELEGGYLSPCFVTDPRREQCVLEDPLILLHEPKLNARALAPVLDRAIQSDRPLLILFGGLDSDALALLAASQRRGKLLCCAVQAPCLGERRRALLEDIAILTGGQVFSAEAGRELQPADLALGGSAQRVVIDHDKTLILASRGGERRIQARIEQLRRQIQETDRGLDREQLEQRLEKLSRGVAVIQVGAPTRAESESLVQAFVDAIRSTQAALAEGIVPGAGLALLQARAQVEQEEASASRDERVGLAIFRHALEVPTRQIARNAGLGGGFVIERMSHGRDGVGLNAATGEYVNLIEAGIVDATKVLRTALENAVSVARLLLLNEVGLREDVEAIESVRPTR
jgi:chaperonin GroEL